MIVVGIIIHVFLLLLLSIKQIQDLGTIRISRVICWWVFEEVGFVSEMVVVVVSTDLKEGD